MPRQPQFLFAVKTWIKCYWTPSMNLDDVTPRVSTVMTHKILVVSELDTHSAGGKTALSPKKIISREEIENLLKKNSDWTADWSSRSENIPPTPASRKLPLNIFKHQTKHTASLGRRSVCLRKKGDIFSAEFLSVFLPSLLLSHHWPVAWGPYWKASGHQCLLMETWTLAVAHGGDCLLKATLNSAIYSLRSRN